MWAVCTSEHERCKLSTMTFTSHSSHCIHKKHAAELHAATGNVHAKLSIWKLTEKVPGAMS